uniref:NADH-ubiquinone oxidoreductase chain 1 n=1 Tax=Hyalomma marginatum TaxID=34627 RepID=A0A889ZE33_9ACAR|nr:NADH dehydrogenase subunit 1 [Hyalomma marginatum]QRE78545.1 NADH dehydrogenase subunit 1 [Hyalomma marginatum]QRE78558.1 NADH dehydrogenase subunit 1 [Hyalomma marginatum]QRE78571.1 NADH dehydrogenase subunit 1 [Hyalomma marginatum]QRF92777.1 NADH dehydrogenase subunit 1 [Hyalomma marginatum]QRF92787.1 NADH dehydrogenase subunit 1 [Hyalomma marginatum]
MLNFIYTSILLIMILLSIAFFTLMERKFLGYCHIRKGPNKTGIMGIFQPFSDALKLFSKEWNKMFYMNKFIYNISPLLMISMMLMMWIIFEYPNNIMNLNLGIIFFICISSITSYSILLSGWASNSKFSLIGSYRGFAQVISYEVSMAIILISLSILPESYNLSEFFSVQKGYPLIFSLSFIFIIWIITILAELNRVPFDLAEGESELVSGFNIEYGSYLFAIIFMSEYGSIMFISFFSIYLFMASFMLKEVLTMMMMMIIIMIRGTYVRMRYDQLMMMAWKIILPQSIMFLFLIYFIFLNYKNFICINFCNKNKKFKPKSKLTAKMLCVYYTI